MPLKMRRTTSYHKVEKKSRTSQPSKSSTTTTLVRELLGAQETKYLDNWVQLSGGTMSRAGSVVDLGLIAEGSDFNQRIGRRIKLKYLQYDIRVSCVTADTPDTRLPIHWTWHLVLDRQPNGTPATVANILDSTVITNGPLRMKNIGVFNERFQILKTEKGFIQPVFTNTASVAVPGSYASDSCQCHGGLVIKEIMQYGGSTASTPTTNDIYLVYMSDDPNDNAIAIEAGIRIAYTDM